MSNNIQEYLCSYELSKLLNEVGYKSQVIAYYDNYPNNILRPVEQDNDSFTCFEDIEKIPQLLYITPLYDQVFDWLEKEHGIYVDLQFSRIDKSWFGHIFKKSNNNRIDFIGKSKREAKEAAIKQAIELIKKRCDE